MSLLLDLCGGSGSWSKPYREAGWEVRKVDTRDGWDVRLDLEWIEEPVTGILAAPPCAVFANSGARWPRSRDDMKGGLSVVWACLAMVALYQPEFWALENPVGKLRRWLGPPRMYFDPCDYGDPWTKKTCLWGRFNEPKPNSVPATEGSRMHLRHGGKSRRTKIAQSMTPEGFAQAFYEANHSPLEQRVGGLG